MSNTQEVISICTSKTKGENSDGSKWHRAVYRVGEKFTIIVTTVSFKPINAGYSTSIFLRNNTNGKHREFSNSGCGAVIDRLGDTNKYYAELAAKNVS